MKRKWSLLMVLAISSSLLLSSCSSPSTPSNTPPATSTTSGAGATAKDTEKEVTVSEDGTEMVGNMYVTGLPIVKEKETFTLFCDDSGTVDEKVMYPILEEQTNMHVELILLPYEAAVEKKNILLNSGDYPDVMGGWIMSANDIMTTGVKEGIYIPLEDHIDKYAPKIQEVLDLEGVRQTMTLPDGHIYSVPYVIEEPLVSFNPYINQAWLDTLGLEMPTTTDQFRDVLRAFKTGDPNGNGKADEIPFSSDPNNLHIPTLAGWFGVNVNSGGVYRYFAMIDGKPTFTATDDRFKEFIKYFAGLYAEGLVDPEIFTQDLNSWKAKGKANLFGVSYAYGSGDFADKVLKEDGLESDKTAYEPLPVLQSDPSITPVFRRNGYGVTTFKNQVVITDRAKNPEAIIRWWDNVYQLENSIQIQAGLFGKTLVKVSDGVFQDIDSDTIPQDVKDTYGWGKMFTQSLPKYWPRGFKTLAPEGKEKPYDEKGAVDRLYEPFLDESMPIFWQALEDAQRSALIQTDIDTYMKKKVAEWVSGQKDVEAEWETHKKDLENLGLSELVGIVERGVASTQE